MDMETEYKHNLLTVMWLQWNIHVHVVFMPAKAVREAYIYI